MIDYAAARLTMVDSQLRTTKVTDEAVLAAFLAVPRERFLPTQAQAMAYVDHELPLGGGRYLMEPMVLGRMLQLAALSPSDKVLEIGCGTGYGTALLARLAAKVVAVESDAGLAQQAKARIAELGVTNAQVIAGKMTEGHAAEAPYDAIVFMGAVAHIPDAIARQLGEGGRLLAVVAESAGIGRAVLMTRVGGVLSQRPCFDAVVPLLPGFQAEPSFVF